MRYFLTFAFVMLSGSLAQAQCVRERAPLFPRLHALLHPQACVPCCPPVIPVVVAEPKPELPKKVDAPAKSYDYVTIRGRVIWPQGLAIPPAKIVNNGPKAMPDFGPVVVNDVLIDPTSRGVKNVIVWLRPDDDVRTKTFPLDQVKPQLRTVKPFTHVIGVKDGNYEPRILAARAGEQLRFVNNSPFAINTHFNSDIEAFNINYPPGSDRKLDKPLEAQRVAIPFSCNIHPWMQGHIRVFDHPYFATTDKDGHFEIKDVPVGKWRIVYHHEQGFHKGKDGLLGFPIKVTPDKPIQQLTALQYEPPSLK